MKTWMVALTTSLALAACSGDDSSPGGAGGTSGTGGAGGVGATGGLAGTGGAAGQTGLGIAVRNLDGQALPGATVAFDAADGTRVEKTAGPDGMAYFDEPAAGAASPTATAHLQGYAAVTVVNVLEQGDYVAGQPYVINLVELERGNTVQVTGDVAALGVGHTLLVTSSDGGSYQGNPEHYSLDVLAGKSFTLLAAEFTAEWPTPNAFVQPFYGFAKLDHAALDANADILLDMAKNHLASETVTGSFALPKQPDSMLLGDGAWGYAMVSTFSSNFRFGLGFASMSKFNSTTQRVDYDIEHVKAAPDSEVGVWYMLYESLGGFSQGAPAYSIATESGYPAAGPRDFVLLEPPHVTYSKTTPRPLHDEMKWVDATPALPTLVQVIVAQRSVWTAVVPPGLDHFTLPAPPSSLSEESTFGSVTFQVSLFKCELSDSLPKRWCKRAAVTPFAVEN